MGRPGRFDIGLLHTSLDGRPGHDVYAPSSVAGLRAKDYDYWALGHVHNREVVSEDPWIVFPGNLQGRHARETGSKGATLVTVEAGEVVAVAHHSFDVVRWLRVEVDITGTSHAEEIAERARAAVEANTEADAVLLAVRLIITGRSAAHAELASDPERWTQELRSQLSESRGAPIFLEKVQIESRSAVHLEAALERADAFGDLMKFVSGLEDASLDLRDFVDSFQEIQKKLPPELLSDDNPDRFDPTDPECLRALLPDVRDLLVTRLVDAEEGA